METPKIRDYIISKGYCNGEGLDLGCGYCKILPNAIGIDVQKLDGVDIVSDIRKLGMIEASSMDYVYSSHALEDLYNPDVALIEWLRVLKPGGYLILYLPHRDIYPRINSVGTKRNEDHFFDYVPQDMVFIFNYLEDVCKYKLSIVENFTHGEIPYNPQGNYSFCTVIKLISKSS